MPSYYGGAASLSRCVRGLARRWTRGSGQRAEGSRGAPPPLPSPSASPAAATTLVERATPSGWIAIPWVSSRVTTWGLPFGPNVRGDGEIPRCDCHEKLWHTYSEEPFAERFHPRW